MAWKTKYSERDIETLIRMWEEGHTAGLCPRKLPSCHLYRACLRTVPQKKMCKTVLVSSMTSKLLTIERQPCGNLLLWQYCSPLIDHFIAPLVFTMMATRLVVAHHHQVIY